MYKLSDLNPKLAKLCKRYSLVCTQPYRLYLDTICRWATSLKVITALQSVLLSMRFGTSISKRTKLSNSYSLAWALSGAPLDTVCRWAKHTYLHNQICFFVYFRLRSASDSLATTCQDRNQERNKNVRNVKPWSLRLVDPRTYIRLPNVSLFVDTDLFLKKVLRYVYVYRFSSWVCWGSSASDFCDPRGEKRSERKRWKWLRTWNIEEPAESQTPLFSPGSFAPPNKRHRVMHQFYINPTWVLYRFWKNILHGLYICST